MLDGRELCPYYRRFGNCSKGTAAMCGREHVYNGVREGAHTPIPAQTADVAQIPPVAPMPSPALGVPQVPVEPVTIELIMAAIKDQLPTVLAGEIEKKVDNTQALSFQHQTCPNSKLKGIFDLREAWVQE